MGWRDQSPRDRRPVWLRSDDAAGQAGSDSKPEANASSNLLRWILRPGMLVFVLSLTALIALILVLQSVWRADSIARELSAANQQLSEMERSLRVYNDIVGEKNAEILERYSQLDRQLSELRRELSLWDGRFIPDALPGSEYSQLLGEAASVPLATERLALIAKVARSRGEHRRFYSALRLIDDLTSSTEPLRASLVGDLIDWCEVRDRRPRRLAAKTLIALARKSESPVPDWLSRIASGDD